MQHFTFFFIFIFLTSALFLSAQDAMPDNSFIPGGGYDHLDIPDFVSPVDSGIRLDFPKVCETLYVSDNWDNESKLKALYEAEDIYLQMSFLLLSLFDSKEDYEQIVSSIKNSFKCMMIMRILKIVYNTLLEYSEMIVEAKNKTGWITLPQYISIDINGKLKINENQLHELCVEISLMKNEEKIKELNKRQNEYLKMTHLLLYLFYNKNEIVEHEMKNKDVVPVKIVVYLYIVYNQINKIINNSI